MYSADDGAIGGVGEPNGTVGDEELEELAGPQPLRHDPSQLGFHLGLLLRRARGVAGMSRSEVAEALDLTVGRVASYEQGTRNISAKRLSRLVDLYGVDIQGLVTEARWLQGLHAAPRETVFRLDVARLLASRENGPLARYAALQPERDVLNLTEFQLGQLAQLYGRTVPEVLDILRPWGVLRRRRSTD